MQNIPAVLFEYEKITDTIFEFGMGVSLKLVADLGFSDKDNRKQRVYNEYRYHNSNKYNNEDYLISAMRKANYYLRIEYPNPDQNDFMKKKSIMILPYSILGMRRKLKEFDNVLLDPYSKSKNGNITIDPNKVSLVRSFPSKNSMIEISHEIYEDKDGSIDYGVKMTFNDEFTFIIRSLTTWKAFIYYIYSCDLYMWGSQLITPYITQLVGNAVSEIGSGDMSTRRYSREVTYEADPDNIAEAENLNKKKTSSKPVTQKDKIKGFFDD